jgi:hypothetical protein
LATNYTNSNKLIGVICGLIILQHVFQLAPFCRFPAHRFFDVLVCGSKIENQPELHFDFSELLLLLLLGLAILVFVGVLYATRLLFGHTN